MLAQRFLGSIETCLMSQGEYHPFPTAEERASWESLPEELRVQVIQRGESYIDFEWPELSAARFLDFARNGNRSRFEKPHHERRAALTTLVLAECVEGKGRFLDDIVNGIWCICEESFWGVPAHNVSSTDERIPLPDVTDPIIDLFAGETAGLLSWTHYLLRHQLDAITPLVGERVRREIKRRILDPYLDGDYWWMGFNVSEGHHVNNWNPWCNSNCLTATLLMEEDAGRRKAAVRKALQSLDIFLASYHSDGGCDEGTSYWNRAGGSLFDCLELLYSATAGVIDVYDEPLIQNIGRYIYRAHICDEWFLNFADGSAKVVIPSDLVYRYGRRIGDSKLMALGANAFHAQRKESLGPGRTDSIMRQLPALFGYSEIDACNRPLPYEGDVFLDGIEVMISREEPGSSQGLYLAAKGGHNNESHNHNDVGQFVVFCSGRPMLIDVGVETYTKKTFSPDRYEIWTMQSAYHNLPTIGGVQQRPGEEARARGVSYIADHRRAELSLDISLAYPPTADVLEWKRTFSLNRCGRTVEVSDRFSLGVPHEVTLNLVTCSRPCLTSPGIFVLSDGSGLGLQVQFNEELEFSCEEIAIDDARLKPVWGDRLFRVILRSQEPVTKGDWRLTMRHV